MHLSAYLLLASLPALIQAHGGHGSSDDSNDAEEGGGWHARHMAEEHHIDAFDLESFFKLHDLNQDGILDHSELSAIYGLHHETSREKSQDEEQHKRKSEEIMSKVLSILDQNGDGLVTKTEFVSAGEKGLPEFSHHEGLGHHYDSEGEYFLHHEEIYHNTPETQTEESYNHPEDIAHFEHHEDIEREEEDKARKAQGLPATNPDIPLDDQTAQPDHDEIDAKLAAKAAGQQVLGGGAPGSSSDNEKEEAARQARSQANKEATEKYNLSKQRQEAKARGAWGDNGEGFKKPKDKVDRLRDRIPYKYRVRSSFFGDF